MAALTLQRVALLAFVLGMAVSSASATSTAYYFTRVTANAPNDVSGLFEMDVEDLGSSTVRFEFLNSTGLTGPSITGIYFDDSGRLTDPGAVTGTGVNFGIRNPANPPGVSSFTSDFHWNAKAPNVIVSGVNPGEVATVDFAITDGYSSVIGALATGDLRVAIHVQSIPPSGLSDSFVIGGGLGGIIQPSLQPPPSHCPEPMTLAGLGAGLVGLVSYLRKRVAR